MQFYIVYKRTTLENVSQRLKVKVCKNNKTKNISYVFRDSINQSSIVSSKAATSISFIVDR